MFLIIENNSLCETLDQLNLNGQLSENFNSYLIKPIQRILKYPLFLGQVNEYCDYGTIQHIQSTQVNKK